MPMKRIYLPLLVIATLLWFTACTDKGPAAELRAAEDAIAAAKAGQVDTGNADLKQAEDALAKAQAEINWQQMNAAVKDYTSAKNLLAQAKRLGEKALADHKAGTAKAKPEDKDAGRNVSKSDPPRIKS